MFVWDLFWFLKGLKFFRFWVVLFVIEVIDGFWKYNIFLIIICFLELNFFGDNRLYDFRCKWNNLYFKYLWWMDFLNFLWMDYYWSLLCLSFFFIKGVKWGFIWDVKFWWLKIFKFVYEYVENCYVIWMWWCNFNNYL